MSTVDTAAADVTPNRDWATDSILQFFPGAFEGGGAVQPVAVTYPYTYFNAAAFTTTLPSHIGRIFLSPWIRVNIEYLPVR